MMDFKISSNWKRLLTEGLVIVVSILLAFAIDAWWDQKQADEAELKKIKLVTAEIKVNAEKIKNKMETIGDARNATSRLISWMGPNPNAIEIEALIKEWNAMVGIGTLSLSKVASNNLLATGDLETARHTAIYLAIAEWYSLGDNLEKQYELLRDNHRVLMNSFEENFPALHLIGGSNTMKDHPKSKFPFDSAMVLTNAEIESRLAHYLIRLEFVLGIAQELYDEQSELIQKLEPEQ